MRITTWTTDVVECEVEVRIEDVLGELSGRIQGPDAENRHLIANVLSSVIRILMAIPDQGIDQLSESAQGNVRQMLVEQARRYAEPAAENPAADKGDA
ncbi:hypothetical protein [Bremerella cremea]|uniref:hypothetical protein n=1 Tax=Bremerella cremea TaxID=1031537 RepID=UPI0031E84D1F